MATVEAMRTANKELKQQYGKVDVDKIDVRGCLLSPTPTSQDERLSCIDSMFNLGPTRRNGGPDGTRK
jgi:hypothetical protein